MKTIQTQILTRIRAVALLAAFVGALFISGLAPNFIGSVFAADQLTRRYVSIGTAVVSANTSYTFGFRLKTAGQVESIRFQACTTALGACTAPTGMDIDGAVFTTQTGWAGATNFAVDATGANECTPANNVLCINRTDTTNETTAGDKTIVFSNIVNPSGASCLTGNPNNCTFFVRMFTYLDNDYANADYVDYGTVASSTTQTLTIAARIQEVLAFCIGTTAVDDATTSVGATCANVSGTTVDMGVLDSASVTVTPVDANPTGGNDLNGVAMLRTNASLGATIHYRAMQQSGTNHLGALRVVGATCDAGTVNTDQCVNSIGGTQTDITAGVEAYGMTIAGVNCASVVAYTCNFGNEQYNLVPDAEYNGEGVGTVLPDTYGYGEGFAWLESGSTDQIAASTGPVDYEALILKFGATPNITTPTGSYTAQGDFIVVPTY